MISSFQLKRGNKYVITIIALETWRWVEIHKIDEYKLIYLQRNMRLLVNALNN